MALLQLIQVRFRKCFCLVKLLALKLFSSDQDSDFRCRLDPTASLQGSGGVGKIFHCDSDHVEAADLQQRHPQPAAEGAGAAGQEERARQVPAARPRADREGVGADVEEELREQRHHSRHAAQGQRGGKHEDQVPKTS